MKTAKKTGAAAKVATAQTATKPVVRNNATPAMKLVKSAEQAKQAADAATKPAKPISDLQNTLQVVATLHRNVEYRATIIQYLDTLNEFEIANEQDEHGDALTGCRIALIDSDGEKWECRNTNLVRDMITYAKGRLNGKLKELEAKIVLPAAA